jgi:carbamoyltransferase
VGGIAREYVSYHHATSHLFSSYCTSPAAAVGCPVLVLVWDGGMLPLLYEVTPGPRVTSHGPLLPVYGNAFAEFAGHFAAFREEFTAEQQRYGRDRPSAVAGKAMAYAGLGTGTPEAFPLLEKLLDEVGAMSIDGGGRLAQRLIAERDALVPGLSDADLIACFQDYLGHALLDAFAEILPGITGRATPNLCLAGCCALNIKWNSALRHSGLFGEVWVPPFPNDSGSALGAAMTHRARLAADPAVEWGVYAGPAIRPSEPAPGWRRLPCSHAQLARLLAERGAPVVVVNGPAELGPRALGNRSILAPAVSPGMKDTLNEIKGREPYRPVAPICLENRAAEIFDPGTPDPYMLFDHRVRSGWADRIPAVVHLDATARLQTVNAAQNRTVAEVLEHYATQTGIPVLCNTSANHRGRGFLPDVASATAWGGVNYVWSDGWLYVAQAAPLWSGAGSDG